MKYQTGQTGTMTRVPAADATLRILEYLAHQRGPVAAQTLASALEIPRSSMYQILEVLTQRGFVVHIPESKRYGLGPASFELSSAYTRQQPLTRLAAPLLAKMVDRVGESAHLSVLHGTDVLYVIEERASRRPSLVTNVGVRLPAHLTASGRALLSALPLTQLRALYPSNDVFTQRSGATATGPQSYRELKALVVAAGEQGYARELGEVTPGLASIGVVVRDHLGWPAAGIALTYPEDGDENSSEASGVRERLLPELQSVAQELTRRIHGAR